MYAYRMLGVEDGVFILEDARGEVVGRGRTSVCAEKTYLTRGVYDVTVVVDTLVVDGLGEDALNGGIVGLDEDAIDKLNRE